MTDIADLQEAFQAKFPDDPIRPQILELRWPDGFLCPHCMGQEMPNIIGKRQLKCRMCQKEINILKGTLFEGSHVKLPIWMDVISTYAVGKTPVSASEIARILGLRQATVQKMLMNLRGRIRDAQTQIQLTGNAEADVWVFQPPHALAEGDTRLVRVFVMVEHNNDRIGRVVMRPMHSLRTNSFQSLIFSHSKEDCVTDVDLPNGQLPRAADKLDVPLLPTCQKIADQTYEWLNDVYGFSMKPENLDLYLAECAFRHSYSGPYSTGRRLRALLKICIPTYWETMQNSIVV